jgi:hypothetical protein
MSLQIPSFPDSQDPSSPILSAVARISGLSLDFETGQGTLDLAIFRSAAAASAPNAAPAAVIRIAIGQTFPAGKFPTIPEAMADPTFAAAWASIRGKLYQWAKAHPALVNATP